MTQPMTWRRAGLVPAAWTPTAIEMLFASRRPAHVSGFVVAVVIDAVNRMMACRPTTHVSQKRLKRLAPAFTHTNSTSAVPTKRFAARVQAARFHADPRYVLASETMPSRVAMRALACPQRFSHQATTRARMATPQMGLRHDARRATVATTSEESVSMSPQRQGLFYGNEPSETTVKGWFNRASHDMNYTP